MIDDTAQTRRCQLNGAATFASALAVLAVGAVWIGPGTAIDVSRIAVGVALMAAVVVAYEFPIYIRHNTKLHVTSIAIYALTVLLSPIIAAPMVLVAVGAGEAVVARRRGSTVGDIATHAGRWGVLAMLGSLAAHSILATSPAHDVALVGDAALLWLGDILTLPLALVPVSGEHPAKLLPQIVREAGLAEASQYVLGLIGALIASRQPWAIGLLVVPGVFVYLAFKKEMDPDTLGLLEGMADTIDLRDPFLADHSCRVAELTRGMLDALGMHGQEAAHIAAAARLHDIGKLDLPTQVFIKDGNLTEEERRLVQSTPQRGAELLSAYPDFSRGIAMVRCHLERWDGSGPLGLAGTDIPFGARVIAITDAFDAMINERSYRGALAPDQAAQILLDGAGRQWDPRLVQVFVRSIGHMLSAPLAAATPDNAVDLPSLAAETLPA